MNKLNIALIVLLLASPVLVWMLMNSTDSAEPTASNSLIVQSEPLMDEIEHAYDAIDKAHEDSADLIKSTYLEILPQLELHDSVNYIDFTKATPVAIKRIADQLDGGRFNPNEPKDLPSDIARVEPKENRDSAMVNLIDVGTSLREKESPKWMFLLLPFLLVVGIFAGEVYRTLQSSDSDKIALSDFKNVIASKSLWKSLFAAPIIYLGIHYLSQDQPDLMVSSLLAFENGFFCNVILSKKQEEA
jgi:hypothetical protein